MDSIGLGNGEGEDSYSTNGFWLFIFSPLRTLRVMVK